MSSIVFILGAGASKLAGAPLMYNFMDVAEDLLRSGKILNRLESSFAPLWHALNGLQRVHSKAELDLANLESILTALEMGQVLGKLPGVEAQDIPNLIRALKQLIVKTLEVTMRFPVKDDQVLAPAPYGEFAQLLSKLRTQADPQDTVSVITFNYDVAIDLALSRGTMGPDYGLGRDSVAPVEDYVQRTLLRHAMEAPGGSRHKPVQLLKLHGSINWAAESATKEIRPLHVSEYLRRYHPGEQPRVPGTFSLSQHMQEHFRGLGIEVDPEPVIVPPSWNKAQHHMTLSHVWAAAAKHLSEAHSIFVIGYSLPETDSFFRLLYALGSEGQIRLRRFVVFNPDETGVTEDRFRSLLGTAAKARYTYRPVKFKEAMPEIEEMFWPKKDVES